MIMSNIFKTFISFSVLFSLSISAQEAEQTDATVAAEAQVEAQTSEAETQAKKKTLADGSPEEQAKDAETKTEETMAPEEGADEDNSVPLSAYGDSGEAAPAPTSEEKKVDERTENSTNTPSDVAQEPVKEAGQAEAADASVKTDAQAEPDDWTWGDVTRVGLIAVGAGVTALGITTLLNEGDPGQTSAGLPITIVGGAMLTTGLVWHFAKGDDENPSDAGDGSPDMAMSLYGLRL